MSSAVFGQAFSKPIRIIVPYPAGIWQTPFAGYLYPAAYYELLTERHAFRAHGHGMPYSLNETPD